MAMWTINKCAIFGFGLPMACAAVEGLAAGP